MRPGTWLLVAVTLVLVTTGSAAAADNTAPLADAGVDQTVAVNSTVYLDANGSVDPDGQIASVAWAIETPGGGTVSPACADCRRTEFDATAVGQYTVTLTVTDDDGATRSDTLYVTASTPGGPDVSLSGPSSTAPETDTTFTANVSHDDASLQTLTWLVNGSVVERKSLDGATANVSLTHSFDNSGEVTVRAVVYDTIGERGSASHQMSIDRDRYTPHRCFDGFCGNGSDKTYSRDGKVTIVETNGQDGLQTSSGRLAGYLGGINKQSVTAEDDKNTPNSIEILTAVVDTTTEENFETTSSSQEFEPADVLGNTI
ncbi:PKD domain-containing protein [Haloarcula onubensis]|uniref:PKD domain-containing protein n=1 Tax=Haloarcula onubensis TaxID=2950539 RepID=A0ABU2FKT6_9EURY|nr:PKD domain-containing protein [Halomicroarcula sp. S3CR25-11]MDS0280867.1 PKD domain-containing protein [Halomicroarcula sp. S3CR25-11]